MCVVVLGAGLSSFDVVSDKFNDCFWNVCKREFVNEPVNVHCVKGFAHVKGYSHSASWRFCIIKTTGNLIANVV